MLLRGFSKQPTAFLCFPVSNGNTSHVKWSGETDDLCCGGRSGYFPPGSPSSGRGELQRTTLFDRESGRGRCRAPASGAVSVGHHGAGKRRAGTLPADPEFVVAGFGSGDFPDCKERRGRSCSRIGGGHWRVS